MADYDPSKDKDADKYRYAIEQAANHQKLVQQQTNDPAVHAKAKADFEKAQNDYINYKAQKFGGGLTGRLKSMFSK